MELAKSTEAFETQWDDGIARWDQAAVDSPAVDGVLTRAWEAKAGLQWVRNDNGPLNGFRWFVWDRCGLGRPPSRVEKRANADESRGVRSVVTSGSPILRFVTPEGPISGGAGSCDGPARLGVVDHS